MNGRAPGQQCDTASRPGSPNYTHECPDPGSGRDAYETCDQSGCYFDQQLVQAEAKRAIANLSTGCRTLFSGLFPVAQSGRPGAQDSLLNMLTSYAPNTAYYDDMTQGSLTLSAVTGLPFLPGSDITLHQFLAASGGDAATLSYSYTLGGQTFATTLNIVVLGSNFFSASLAQQQALLVHELLHVAIGDHDAVAALLGVDIALLSPVEAGKAIDAFLASGKMGCGVN